eukprot:c9857_g1_i2.p1 GENE.c9857_g1_i2~~c9857_g1_i2.p1  ORF type:complete len:465 (+),score=78.67 c9857_g1_i2:162-1397(+)
MSESLPEHPSIPNPFSCEILKSSEAVVYASTAAHEYEIANPVKSVRWSPDGSCLLVISEDNSIRLFNTPPELYAAPTAGSQPEETLECALLCREAGVVYDHAWYPHMSSAQPATCCFATSSKLSPVHLWDAFNGSLRASYCAFNHADEITSVNCIAFNPTGGQIFCGSERTLRVFDTSRPGRECTTFSTARKKRSRKAGAQSGILSCIAFSSVPGAQFAVGSYSGSIALYDEISCAQTWITSVPNGVTQVHLSPDGVYLTVGMRRCGQVLCYDLRNTSEPLNCVCACDRVSATNQRVWFDIDAGTTVLVSGSTDGAVRGYDMVDGGSRIFHTQLSGVSLPAVSLHPHLPVFAFGTGERLFADANDDNDENGDEATNKLKDSSEAWDVNGDTKTLQGHNRVGIAQLRPLNGT